MRKNILVISYWSYKEALVQTYTLPYLEMIHNSRPNAKVYFVSFESQKFKMSQAEWKQEVHKWQSLNIHLLRFRYFRFGTKAIFQILKTVLILFAVVLRNRIGAIHTFANTAGAIGWILKQITFCDLVIDSYEPHAENMVENGEWKKDSKSFKILHFFEKRITLSAKHVIATTSAMKQYAKSRFQHDIKSFFVKPAGVDLNKFNPSNFVKNELRNKFNIPQDSIVGVYIGKFGGIYYKEETFLLMKAAQQFWKSKIYFLICTPFTQEEFQSFLNQYHIDASQVIFMSYVPHHQVPEMLAAADFGINPVKPLPTKRYCTSVKDGEYWAMSLPVIITPNISDDSELIQNEQIGVIWEDASEEGCMQAIQKLDELLHSPSLQEKKIKIRKIASELRAFENFQKIYSTIYG